MNSDSKAIDAESEEVIPVTLDDPEWQDAISRFQGYRLESGNWKYCGVSDPRALADLFRSGQQIPEIVILTIAQMLAPKHGWTGGTIRVEFPEKRHSEAWLEMFRKYIEIRKMRKEYDEKDWGFEAFITKATKDFNLGKTRIVEIINYSDLDLIRIASQKFGIEPED